MSGSSMDAAGTCSQSSDEDAELEQYQAALHNLEQQRDAVRLHLSDSLQDYKGHILLSACMAGS